MTYDRDKIHDVLRAAMKERGVTMYRLALLSGYTYPTVFGIVSRNESIQGAVRCLKALGYSVEETITIEAPAGVEG